MFVFQRLLLSLCLPMATLLAVSGCGPANPLVPVSGTVTLDGQPIADASVTLSHVQGGRPGSGRTDESGNFVVTTMDTGDGVLPGRHAVTVMKQRITGMTEEPGGLEGVPGAGGIKTEWLVPRRYSNQKTSGLTAEVRQGMEPLRFELTSK